MIGLVGKKCGMTRLYTENGVSIPVTVVKVDSNRVVSIKSKEKEGYRAIQVTSGVCRSNKLTKAEIGHFRKARVEAGRLLLEFRIDENELEISEKLRVGLELNVDIFKESMKVDVVGRTKGKGFAGVVKRHNFHMQDILRTWQSVLYFSIERLPFIFPQKTKNGVKLVRISMVMALFSRA